MQAGCPVITLHSSSIPEICGNAVLFADDVSPDAFAEKIRLLDDISVCQHLREAGFVQAGRFSWQENCRKTVELYKELLQEQ